MAWLSRLLCLHTDAKLPLDCYALFHQGHDAEELQSKLADLKKKKGKKHIAKLQTLKGFIETVTCKFLWVQETKLQITRNL